MEVIETLAIGSNIFIAYALLIGVLTYIKSLRQKRRAVSLEFIRRWNEGGYFQFLSELQSQERQNDFDLKYELLDSVDNWDSDNKLNGFKSIWNFFEELSIAITFGEADDAVAKDFFFYALINTYRISEPSFYRIRERNHNKALYLNFERLFGKWSTSKEYLKFKEVDR